MVCSPSAACPLGLLRFLGQLHRPYLELLYDLRFDCGLRQNTAALRLFTQETRFASSPPRSLGFYENLSDHQLPILVLTIVQT